MPGGVLIDASRTDDDSDVVRSTLTLSLLSGRPVRVVRIRSSRGGLREGDLAVVKAAALISDARLAGAEPGSTELFFQPRGVRPGEYGLDFTPAPCTPGLMAVALPLAMAAGPSRLRVSGSTHVAGTPPLETVQNDWLSLLARLGFSLSLRAEQVAFSPSTDGRVLVLVGGSGRPHPLRSVVRANLQAIAGMVILGDVPRELGNRMARELRRQLRRAGVSVRLDLSDIRSEGTGVAVRIEAILEGGDRLGFGTVAGDSTSPERTARRLVNHLFEWLDTGTAFPPFHAEELILPLVAAIARGPSVFTTSRVTPRLSLRAELAEAFLPIRVEIEENPNRSGEIRLRR